MTIDENALNIYTDGSSFSKPRVGGIGVRFVLIDSSGQEQIEDIPFAGYKNATNNQMELQACILALKEALHLNLTKDVTNVIIWSDSMYVVDYYKTAIFQWSKNKWRNAYGRPVQNAQLWQELIKYLKKYNRLNLRVDIKWVKGHSRNVHNRAANRMARQSAKLPLNKPLSNVNVRRKITSESVDVGSVSMQGQRISIHIITCEYLQVQRVWKYKYEVISRKSQFYGLVDIIFSEISLKHGHSYYVKVNTDTNNPTIVSKIRELTSK